MADHAIVTIGVLSAEVVSAATDMVGKDGRVTITSVGRSGDTPIALAANGSVVGWQRRIQGHVFGMCNPLYDVPRLLRLWREGDEVNRGYQDLLSGKNIRGMIMHAK
jgi:alcohol dehydrogenase (nicotinoprotein)